MTWTYTGNPASSSKDEVRFYIQDTESTDPLLTDEEIAFVLVGTPDPLRAAVFCAERIAAKFARFVNSTVGQISENASDRVKQYTDLAAALEAQAAALCEISVGGATVAQKDTLDADTTLTQPFFKRGQFDMPPEGQ